MVEIFKMTSKLSKEEIDDIKQSHNKLNPQWQELGCNLGEKICPEFLKTEEYKSGDTSYRGYVVCCETCSYCGTSGWVIFLIIVLVLGVLAGGAAAFWLFYWKRKRGGQEVMVEEKTESTENSKSGI